MCRHWRCTAVGRQRGGGGGGCCAVRWHDSELKFTPVAVLDPANFSRRCSLLAAKFIMKLERMAGIGRKGWKKGGLATVPPLPCAAMQSKKTGT